MKVLDLFSGLGGFSEAFKDGHDVFRVDIERRFVPDLCIDIRRLSISDILRLFGRPDVVLASPPCNCFSVASIGNHWKGGVPDEETRKAIHLVGYTMSLILDLHPRFWYFENPMGMLRRVLGRPPITTYFASWGDPRKKPTDIWGVHAKMKWKEPEKWVRASRGARTGTQGISTPEERAKIPYDLSRAICEACEKEFAHAQKKRKTHNLNRWNSQI